MALVSPGLQLTVTDESQYISNAVGTVPLVVMATAENKTINGALATGTTEANAGALQVFGSQRDLTTAMGTPVFQQSSAGTPLHGNELNEYGLMAAYSALGLGNQLYAIRANIDLNQLQSTSVRPTGAVASGTEWFDLADTTWGIYEWSADTQTYTNEVPTLITSSSQCVSTTQGSFSSVLTPVQSYGQVGTYAVVVSQSYVGSSSYDNKIFYKAGNNIGSIDPNSINNTWVLVGTPKWHASHPTVIGTVANATVSTGSNISINNTTVTITGSNVATFAANVNSASIPGVKADVLNYKLALYSDGTSSGLTANDGKIVLSTAYNGSGNTNILSAFGLTANVAYIAPQSQYSTFANVPSWTNSVSGDVSAPNGSVWLKTTATGGGANFVFKQYNSLTGLWTAQTVTSYPNELLALYGLDPTGGGINIPAGTLYVKQDNNPYNTGVVTGYASYKAKVRQVFGAVTAVGNVPGPTPFSPSNSFTLIVSQPGLPGAGSTLITVGGTGLVSDFVAAIQKANIPNILVSITSTGAISITHLAGGDITLTNVSGTPVANAGFVSGIPNTIVSSTGNAVTITGWQNLVYTFSTTEPVADPEDGTLWYYGDPTVVDIMINNGSNWVGYQNLSTDARGYPLTTTDPMGVIVAASQPFTQSDGSNLVMGDLWLDTSDLENWPLIRRYDGLNWNQIDNTDQVSQNGILFADARWDNSGTTDAASDPEITTQALLTSNYLDLDAPNPLLYPRGMLLFNTRRSGYNVKKYVASYFGSIATWNVPVWNAGQKVYYGADIYVATTSSTNQAPYAGSSYWTKLAHGSWVTASGLKNDGSPYAGHFAQRQVIIAAMKAALDANTEIREDQFTFSLICAPGYPELIPDMVSLNNDRANTAFIIGDTPLSLSTNAVDIINWSNDTNGDGLATADPYLGVYYPGGLSSDLSGNTIMVPASHMALRTFLYNDNVAYPWFAPAGTRRGLVSNATDLGYVNFNTGEFVRTGVNQALRDTLYENNINPITIIPGIGLVVWGQKTRDPNTESMDRINVARLVNYIRTIFASAGNAFLFEPNDKITRDQFAAILNRALNDLVAKRGLYDYLVVCDTTNNTPDRIANNQLYADIAIEPMKDVEFIYIPIRLYNPGDIAALGSM